MVNLVYIRAAIEANTGIRLSLSKTRQYLVEEGLITKAQADRDASLFRGYSEFYEDDVPSRDIEDPLDTEYGIPDIIIAGR